MAREHNESSTAPQRSVRRIGSRELSRRVGSGRDRLVRGALAPKAGIVSRPRVRKSLLGTVPSSQCAFAACAVAAGLRNFDRTGEIVSALTDNSGGPIGSLYSSFAR